MLLLECKNIKKYFGDRVILDIKHLKIYSEDRIGLVGVNGEGKTTLIKILAGVDSEHEGSIKTYGSISLIEQLNEENQGAINIEAAKAFGANAKWKSNLSGGEKTRFKLAKGFYKNSNMIIADEPTSNLDIEGIEILQEKFRKYKGAFIIVSHDREFLDQLCNKIIDLNNGKIKEYKGNYSDYTHQKDQEHNRKVFEYEQYIKEKDRIEGAIEKVKRKGESVRRTPKRMGNSEARLHRMGGQKAKANLSKTIKNMEKRLGHMDIKGKPSDTKKIQLDIQEENKLHSNIVIWGNNINKVFENKVIFEGAEFNIYNNSKNAIIGPNGCGKSTLLKMIVKGDNSIKKSQAIKIGYYSQNLDIVEDDMSILENVTKSSIYDETFVRITLARLLFKDKDVYKKVKVLSGGEKVKVCFAKLILSHINLLILDEPTNYLDVNSLEAVEEVLKSYPGTVLVVSHDRRFINSIADNILYIEDYKIKALKGTYEEYIDRKNNTSNEREEDIKTRIMVLENRLSEVIGKLSAPSKKDDIKAIDNEYYEILKELKELKLKLKNI